MHALFLDEFGHPEWVSPRKPHQSSTPVFGYGGFFIPAEYIAGFATQFFDMKTIAMRNMLLSKWENPKFWSQVERSEMHERINDLLDRLRDMKNEETMNDPMIRRLCAKYEIKGDEIFSRQYIIKQYIKIREENDGGARVKIRNLFNFARWFLRTLHAYSGELFFYGSDKKMYKSRDDWSDPHLSFLSPVLSRANTYAKNHNTVVSIYMDRHHSDYIGEDVPGEKHMKSSKYYKVGRIELSRNIILANGYYDNITEPVVAHESDLSQCVQVADWLCYLLSQVMPYLCDRQRFSKYKEFHDAIEDILFSKVSEVSSFKFPQGENAPLQKRFEFQYESIAGKSANRRRPYHQVTG